MQVKPALPAGLANFDLPAGVRLFSELQPNNCLFLRFYDLRFEPVIRVPWTFMSEIMPECVPLVKNS